MSDLNRQQARLLTKKAAEHLLDEIEKDVEWDKWPNALGDFTRPSLPEAMANMSLSLSLLLAELLREVEIIMEPKDKKR